MVLNHPSTTWYNHFIPNLHGWEKSSACWWVESWREKTKEASGGTFKDTVTLDVELVCCRRKDKGAESSIPYFLPVFLWEKKISDVKGVWGSSITYGPLQEVPPGWREQGCDGHQLIPPHHLAMQFREFSKETEFRELEDSASLNTMLQNPLHKPFHWVEYSARRGGRPPPATPSYVAGSQGRSSSIKIPDTQESTCDPFEVIIKEAGTDNSGIPLSFDSRGWRAGHLFWELVPKGNSVNANLPRMRDP